MTAAEFVSRATEVIYLVILLVVLVRAARLRGLPSIEIALFFGVIVGVLELGNLARLFGFEGGPVVTTITFCAIGLLPYQLLRLLNHFSPQPRWLMLAGLMGTVGVAVVGVVTAQDRPAAINAVPVVWFVLIGGWASIGFANAARGSRGVTARRLSAVAIGSACIALALLVVLATLAAPTIQAVAPIATQFLVVASGVSYYVGFATPAWLRRAWQEPDIRSFMAESADLTREPNERVVVKRLERLAADVLGIPATSIGLLDDDGRVARYIPDEGEDLVVPAERFIPGRAIAEQRPVYSRDPVRDDPDNTAIYTEFDAQVVMAAPMSVGERRYGVLSAFASRAPLFATSDLELTAVLAEQAASVIEARRLLRESAEMQAREAAARAREDFLSAAAHDLRTPLASMMLRVELLRRRLSGEGLERHADAVAAIQRDAERVSDFVTDLLDSARAEHGPLSSQREPTDLVEVARDVVDATTSDRHECVVSASGPIVAEVDRRRIRQVFENLVGNAIKYSPDGGEVVVELRRTESHASVAVIDRGIGIPAQDIPELFERFSRGRNVGDRRYSGLGLGLFICRRIVEEHAGRIWAESEEGRGTTLRFELPLAGAGQA